MLNVYFLNLLKVRSCGQEWILGGGECVAMRVFENARVEFWGQQLSPTAFFGIVLVREVCPKKADPGDNKLSRCRTGILVWVLSVLEKTLYTFVRKRAQKRLFELNWLFFARK